MRVEEFDRRDSAPPRLMFPTLKGRNGKFPGALPCGEDERTVVANPGARKAFSHHVRKSIYLLRFPGC
jgi:hypothetical protein